MKLSVFAAHFVAHYATSIVWSLSVGVATLIVWFVTGGAHG